MIEWIKIETEYEETKKEKVNNYQLYYENFTGQCFRANKSEIDSISRKLNEFISDGRDIISLNEYLSILGCRENKAFGDIYGIQLRRSGP